MGRPRKAGSLRMDTDLRIPLTREQKALIVEATKDEMNPPNRKSIRGVLSEHVQKGLMERVAEGRFRFVFETQPMNAIEAG